MGYQTFRTTKGGVDRVTGWLDSKPKKIVPSVKVPPIGEWYLRLDELGADISGPTIMVLDIAGVPLPQDLLEEIRQLASRDEVVVVGNITSTRNPDPETKGLFRIEVGQVTLQIWGKLIPDFGKYLDSIREAG